MNGKGERLMVIRARFSLETCESRIDEIVTAFRTRADGNRRIEIYRQIPLPRDMQWLIYSGENSVAEEDDLFCERLIAALGEHASVDSTVWQTVEPDPGEDI
jgi:hypothetical protein